MGQNLYQKVIKKHTVAILPSGQIQLLIGAHLIHEVTSPQAFAMIKEHNIKVAFPKRTFATADHIIPTHSQARPFQDDLAETMMQHLENNAKEYDLHYFGVDEGKQGIVHIIGPENGITQPGMTIACGDSHTSTHGAFGAIAFGIGTSQVRDVLATQTLAVDPLKVRQIRIDGKLKKGVYAKDVILYIIMKLGVKAGVGHAYEFAGSVFETMTMEERMTVCNMAIEAGARVGYINPDQTTYDYLKGRLFAPSDEKFPEAVAYYESIKTDAGAVFDDTVVFSADDIEPIVTWGITPGQAIKINERIPVLDTFSDSEKGLAKEAYEYMSFEGGSFVKGTQVDVVFIGSCTNGRISDLKIAASIVKGRKVAPNVSALAVPGSHRVKKEAEKEGLDKIFTEAGFEWREPGCSMCLAMNPDKLKGRQISASTSNRNFKGRQGSPSGRTLLMSPAMAAYAAIQGRVEDVREIL